MAFRHPRATRQRSTRKSLWLQFVPITVTLGAANSALAFSLNAAALALRPFTVVRTHFEVMMISDQAAAVEQQVAGLGIAVVSDQAIAVGITAVPTPVSELGSSLWFVNQLLLGEESHQTDLTLAPNRYSIDSKAMRKVETGSDIGVMLETITIGGSGGAIFNVGGRILIKTN